MSFWLWNLNVLFYCVWSEEFVYNWVKSILVKMKIWIIDFLLGWYNVNVRFYIFKNWENSVMFVNGNGEFFFINDVYVYDYMFVYFFGVFVICV